MILWNPFRRKRDEAVIEIPKPTPAELMPKGEVSLVEWSAAAYVAEYMQDSWVTAQPWDDMTDKQRATALRCIRAAVAAVLDREDAA